MLRLIALLLVLANGVYYAWSQNALRAWGLARPTQNEPQRAAAQIRPEALRLLDPEEVRRLAAAEAAEAEAETAALAEAAANQPRTGTPPPGRCLQAGPFNEAEGVALRARAQALLPAGRWSLEAPPAATPRWIVYMGRYPNAEQRDRKRGELRALQVASTAPGDPALEPGLSLGSYSTQAEAGAGLAALAQRGVRTARVVEQRPAAPGATLRLASVDEALQPALASLATALAGRPLRPCD